VRNPRNGGPRREVIKDTPSEGGVDIIVKCGKASAICPREEWLGDGSFTKSRAKGVEGGCGDMLNRVSGSLHPTPNGDCERFASERHLRDCFTLEAIYEGDNQFPPHP
jgi:hypothetical protein